MGVGFGVWGKSGHKKMSEEHNNLFATDSEEYVREQNVKCDRISLDIRLTREPGLLDCFLGLSKAVFETSSTLVARFVLINHHNNS